jgi:hypothetical protein
MLRHALLMGLLAATMVSMGCQAERPARFGGEQALLARGDGVQLFGPTPLPLGEEDMGYFAYAPPAREPLYMYDFSASYVRTRIWNVEDNARPNQSYYRRRVFSDEVRASYR